MNHVSATIGTRAVDPRKLADDKFNKRMGNFDKICKQIDAKYDHVMEMLADIQEQLRNLERKQRKEAGVRFCAGDAQFQHQMAAIKPTPSLSPLFSTFQPSPQTPPPPSQMEAIKPSLLPPYIISKIDAYEDAEMLVDEQKVFDEIPESENSKISVILPLVHGSEIAEVYDFGVLNPQFQTPLVSTQEIKMEPEGLSLISSPSSFSSNSDGTKLEDEGSVEVPIYTTVTELQPRESESGFEVFPNLSIRELFPSGRIIVSSLLHSPFLYNCYNGDGLTKEELKWLDTGQNLVVSDFSRDGVGFDLIVCWNLMNKICWDKNTLVSGMQLKDSWSEWGEIKIVVRGANNHEQNSGALRIQELVDCVSLYVMNFTCLAFAYDPGICCMCWNESLVHVSEIMFNNFVAANLKVGLHGVKVLKNVSVFHHSLVNPTVGLEDAIPLQEINSLHTAEGGQVDQDLMSALKEFGLAKFHFTANGFGNDPLHCFKETVNKFLRYYEGFDSRPVFESVKGILKWAGLYNLTTTTLGEKLVEVGLFPILIQELATVITRINYGQSMNISGLASAVSLAGSGGGLWSIKGGNWQMAAGLINHSNVELYLDEEIESIFYLGDVYELNSTKAKSYHCQVTVVATPLDEVDIHFKPGISIPPRKLHDNILGEALRGWEFDHLLRWIILGNEHMVHNLLGGRDPILVSMHQRPPSKPPFQFLQPSLGDKTHSRGEYCHVHGYDGIGNKERRREINGSVGVLIMLGLDLIVFLCY